MRPDYDDCKKTIRAMKDAWGMTKQRCFNPNQRDYRYYGGRGIRVCDRWLVFSNFLEDMGVRPPGMTLERVDNDGDYEPGNCVWATRKTQSSNTRMARMITWQGRTQCISDWERELGIRQGTLKARLGPLGYDIETAMKKPVKCGGLVPGRAYPPRRKPDMTRVPRGINHPFTKLSAEEASACRSRWLRGEKFTRMALEFNVSVETMSCACQGQGAYRGVHDD